MSSIVIIAFRESCLELTVHADLPDIAGNAIPNRLGTVFPAAGTPVPNGREQCSQSFDDSGDCRREQSGVSSQV